MVPVTVRDPVTGIVSLILNFDPKTDTKLPVTPNSFSFTLKTKSESLASSIILPPTADVLILE